eukprot:CAMPEP_0172157634 /NCGR_PEP_ID=MMETSP1050-20130122/3904_1 /TAXON_ID=233186 /ORGANISM="Cryptomonas curvata, Strain CCAP979/52" /LENGTH=861 /DNA_ID=CAMNT_0012826893 /DNA_START=233 /DNA_END=2818 /DNA_ORIENTATION=-
MGCSPSSQGNAVVINIVSTKPRAQRPSTTPSARKQSTQSIARQNTAKLSTVKIPDILASLAEPQSDSVSVAINAPERPIQSLTASTVSSASAVELREKEIAGISIGDIDGLAASKARSRANSRETVKVQKRLSSEALDQRENLTVQQLGEDYARFLVVYTSTILDGGKADGKSDAASKPKLESRGFKPHTMDNISVRKLCEEMIFLQDRSYKMPDDDTRKTELYWMPTLRISLGSHVHSLDLRRQLNISVGGYFMLAQVLGFTQSLLSLDLSGNGLRADEAGVLAMGLYSNRSLKDMRLKGNMIGCEGATSLAEVFRANTTLLLLDLRENGIRSNGMCALTDGLYRNTTLTHIDVRWNYFGESADYVEVALLDLKGFCLESRLSAQRRFRNSGLTGPDGPGGGAGVFGSNGTCSRQSSNQSLIQGVPQHITSARGCYAEPAGRLEITILEAHNLPQVMSGGGRNEGSYGFPQAYCTCAVNSQSVQTQVAPRNYNPAWNEAFEFSVSAVWNLVTVRVRHAARAEAPNRQDTTIGMVCIPVGSVINWRGVTSGLDGRFKAIYRPLGARKDPGRAHAFKFCTLPDPATGVESDMFDTADEAAKAYDATALLTDGEEAQLNFSGKHGCVGVHMKEATFSLVGANGLPVLGVQAGVCSEVGLRMKFSQAGTDYLEIHLDRATCLPKMDPGLFGTADPYVTLAMCGIKFHSRVVRNSLNPEFNQTFRIAIPDRTVAADGGPDGCEKNGKPELDSQDNRLHLRLEVFDWDRFDADDFMGSLSVNLSAEGILVGEFDKCYVLSSKQEEPHLVEAAEEGSTLVNGQGEKSCIYLRFSYFASPRSESDDEDEQDDDERAIGRLTGRSPSEI